MKNIIKAITCLALAGCETVHTEVIRGVSPGIEYHNQATSPWPWIFVMPSERALAIKAVEFDALSKHFHFDMSFEPHRPAFEDVQLVLLDYYATPPEKATETTYEAGGRPARYFMIASFYRMNNRPPADPDFQVTTSLDSRKAGINEAMRYMAKNIIEEIHALSDDCLLTPGRRITVNLD